MKRFITIMFLIFAALLSLCSCSGVSDDFETVYNYMQASGVLTCGKYFVKMKDKAPYVFTEGGSGYYAVNNAVTASQTKMSGLLNADESSFYYYEWQGDNAYGSSIGYSIYRYYPETRKRKLIFSDASITNFDSALGLEDVFSIAAPTSGHGVNMRSGFYFTDGKVIPEYALKSEIADEIIKQNLDIELSPLSLSFVVTDNKVFFKDISDKIWRYDPKNNIFDEFYAKQTSMFFATSKNVFILPNSSGNIKALDLTGNELKELNTENAEFSIGSLQEFSNNCYLRDESGCIWLIDSELNIVKTDTIALGDWCVKAGKIILLEGDMYEGISSPPMITDTPSNVENLNEPTIDQTSSEQTGGNETTHTEKPEHIKHDFKIISSTQATCISKGKEQYLCDCGETYEKEIDIMPHVPNQRKFCTDEIVCLNCTTAIEPGREHDMSSEVLYNNDATCTANGTVTIKCSLCEYTEISEAEGTALGHADDDNNGLCDRCSIQMKHDNSTEQIINIVTDFWKLIFDTITKQSFEDIIK